jgi:tryptophan-rich sensory protein
MSKLLKFIVSLGSCFTIAYLGSAATLPSITSWYAELNKPFFSPPNWLFGPVWSLLYLLMGIAMYVVWQKGWNKKIIVALQFFIAQLLLNFLWSYLFFTQHKPLEAFVNVIVLWTVILLTILKFRKISKPAAWLLAPYLFWVSFASLLNLAIVVLN